MPIGVSEHSVFQKSFTLCLFSSISMMSAGYHMEKNWIKLNSFAMVLLCQVSPHSSAVNPTLYLAHYVDSSCGPSLLRGLPALSTRLVIPRFRCWELWSGWNAQSCWVWTPKAKSPAMALNPLTPKKQRNSLKNKINNQPMNTQKTPVYFSKAKIRKNCIWFKEKKR